MKNKPFLTNFAVKRKDKTAISKITYDDELDMNIINYDYQDDDHIICSTQTYTKVVNEAPDRDINENYDVLYSTQTFTEVKMEKPDRDITEFIDNA